MLFFLEGVAFIMVFLALSETQGEFGDASGIEIELGRHECKIASLQLSDKPINLGALQKEFPRSERLVIVVSAIGVFSDVHTDDLHFVARCDPRERLDNRALPGSK